MKMDLNNESSAFRNTDPGLPGLMALRYRDQLESHREDNREWPDSQFPFISISSQYGGREDSFLSNQQSSRAIAHSPVSRWGESIDGFQQLHEEEIDVCLKALHDLQNFTGEHAKHMRIAAVETLGSMGKRAPIEPLVIALGDPFWDVRAAAVQALGTFEERIPGAILISMLRWEKDESVRETIIHTLGQRIPINELIHVLRFDENWMPRRAAARVLGELGTSAAVKWLITALKYDIDESVRAASANALGKSGKRSAKKALSEALLDPEEEVRETALQAIEQLDGRGAQKSSDSYASPHHPLTEPLPSGTHITPTNISTPDPTLDRSTRPEFDDLSEEEILGLLLLEEKEEALYAQATSPVWGELRKEHVVRLFADFLRDKRGYVTRPTMLQTAGGPTLLLTCFYQHSKLLREVVLQTVRQTTPIESINAALNEEDEIIGEALKQSFEQLEGGAWMDLLIVSMDLSHRTLQAERREPAIRVVVSGMGSEKVHYEDAPILDQIVTAWKTTLQEPPVCQHPEDLADVKVWYQPSPDYVL